MTGDRPNPLPDYEVEVCRRNTPPLVAGIGLYQWLFGYYLEREITHDEARYILSKMRGLGPIRYEESWDSVMRSTEAFWRSQV